MSTTTTRLARLAPLAGTGAAILTIAGYLRIGPNPDSNSSVSTIRTYYATHHHDVFVAGILLTYAAVLYAVFGLSVWARIRRTTLHPVVAGVALVATAVGTVTDITYAGGWSTLGDVGGNQATSAGTLQTLHLSVASGYLGEAAGDGMLLLAFAVAGISARAFPRWLAWPALVLGILQLAPTPGLIGFFAGLAVLPWMLAAGIAMCVRPGDTAPATAPGSPAPLAGAALTGG
jgi:hypothetical protein